MNTIHRQRLIAGFLLAIAGALSACGGGGADGDVGDDDGGGMTCSAAETRKGALSAQLARDRQTLIAGCNGASPDILDIPLPPDFPASSSDG